MTFAMGFDITLGSTYTSLTLNAQLYDTSGTNSGSAITTGFAEIGTGKYYWYYASFADSFQGGAKFYTQGATGTIHAHKAINPPEYENVDTKTSTRSDGTLVTLANDAITSAKYDESSAYPVKSADTGSTKIARTGADSDTLETLSDEIATRSDFDEASDRVRLSTTGIADILTTALTESYAADGAAATLSQLMYAIKQFHDERTVGATTITVKKLDGSTTAYTLTYDADSITRAT